jgi:hypothetical protein
MNNTPVTSHILLRSLFPFVVTTTQSRSFVTHVARYRNICLFFLITIILVRIQVFFVALFFLVFPLAVNSKKLGIGIGEDRLLRNS